MHAEIADELDAQNARFGDCPARAAHLAALRRGARAVLTGQQVGLFLGPLFTLYKAASAIRNAQALSEERGETVVPVFWLQTEDHDLVEIASIATPELTLSVPVDAANRRSIAHLRLPDAVGSALEDLRVALGHAVYFDEHFERLSRHYRAGARWSDAFAGFLAELFASSGLVIVDPRTPTFARHAAPVHRRALVEAPTLAESLKGRREAVHVRAGAPLCFFHPEGIEGPRYRLEPRGDGFAEVGGRGVHSLDALLARLEQEPLAFSTSALLRPLVQDSIFSTAAYVGGPGELAYFEQLAPLYPLFAIAMPRIVPRARFRIVRRNVRERLDRLGLSPSDLERPIDELLTPERPVGDALSAALMSAMEETLARWPVDRAPTPLRQTRAAFARHARRLGRRVDRALARGDADRIEALTQLRHELQPDGAPQERVYGISGYAARYGEAQLVDRVLRAIQPFDGTLRELEI